jgi:Cof subfamily protein (haloacid dehalogenase superfamily)
MSNKYRGLVVTDLDGTLLADRRVSCENLAALKSAKQLGYGIVIATGRNVHGVRRRIIDWELEGIVDIIIGCNGSEIIDFNYGEDTEIIGGIGPDVIADVTTILNGKKYGCCYYTPTNVHSNPDNPELDYIASELKVPIIIHEDINEGFPALQPKFIIFLHSEADRYFRDLLETHKQAAYDTCFSSPIYLEILPVGMSKALGLKVIIERYQINYKDVLVLGDNDNDVEMFKLVPNSVVMGNGTQLAMAAAKIKVSSNEHHGVAEGVHWFIDQMHKKY